MPASIVLADACWASPDGTAVLRDLNLTFAEERTGIVGRNGIGKSTLLKLLSGQLRPSAGTIAVNGTVAALRQLVQVSPRETIADLFGVAEKLAILRKAEMGTASVEELAQADWTLEVQAADSLAQVGLDVSLDIPLVRLSGGQRTRAALAGALFAAPDFLLLDEPTNDLDREGRRAVRDLLSSWRSGTIVVSHDRELLENMDAIVELTSRGAARYGGNWTRFSTIKDAERGAAERDAEEAERRLAKVRRDIQEGIERKQRRDRAGSRKAARGDMPRILAGTLRDRAEKSGGQERRVASRIQNEAVEAAEKARERLERVQLMTVELPASGLAASRRVLDIERVRFGYVPGRPILEDVSASIVGPERVAITGANASGKSTLLAIAAGSLDPWSGKAKAYVPFAFFDQRVSLLDPQKTVAENYRRLNPGADNNSCRSVLARFLFRAAAADQEVAALSGGQLLRAGLACVLGGSNPPSLLILDEPTNHLDLDSIAAIEAALRLYDGALLVVSHDEAFLEAIGIERRLAVESAKLIPLPQEWD